jgi:hypothetical protein
MCTAADLVQDVSTRESPTQADSLVEGNGTQDLLALSRKDRGAWSLAILGPLKPKLAAELVDVRSERQIAFLDYLRGLVANRRRKPSTS